MEYITRLKQNINPVMADIDLREIARGFSSTFTDGIYVIETAHKQYARLELDIRLSHLHHLLGLHKLQNSKYSKRPEKVMDKIYSGDITLEDIKKDANFYSIKDRILCIRLLFLLSDRNTDVRLCQPKPKTHLMDIGIIEPNSEKHIILGLGESKPGVYHFKTLIIDKHIHNNSSKIKILKAELEQ